MIFFNVQYFLRKTLINSIFFFPLKLDSPALWIYYYFLLKVLFLTGGIASLNYIFLNNKKLFSTFQQNESEGDEEGHQIPNFG